MKCVSPLTKKLSDGRVISFPCSRCAACVQRDYNDLIVRGAFEFTKHKHIAHFVTLTYRNECLPSDDETQFKQLSLFIKRLKITLQRAGKESKLSYLIVTERGTQFNRIHHHALIFGLPHHIKKDGFNQLTRRFIYEIWGQGITDTELARGFSAYLYTIKYCLKNKIEYHAGLTSYYYNNRHISKNFGKPTPEISREIRIKYYKLIEHYNNFHTISNNVDHYTVQIHNHTYAIPRYVKQQILSQIQLDLLSSIQQKSLDYQDDQITQAKYRVLEKRLLMQRFK